MIGPEIDTGVALFLSLLSSRTLPTLPTLVSRARLPTLASRARLPTLVSRALLPTLVSRNRRVLPTLVSRVLPTLVSRVLRVLPTLGSRVLPTVPTLASRAWNLLSPEALLGLRVTSGSTATVDARLGPVIVDAGRCGRPAGGGCGGGGGRTLDSPEFLAAVKALGA